MARRPRIEFNGAFYHIIIRGNQKQKIFKGKNDFLKYLEILTGYKQRYKFLLYSYVLMSNHLHLLIETQSFPLSKILQGINQSYTMYFNKRYKTVGHLFQGRYKAILCDRDGYLLSLIKYIHLNPVRAEMTKRPDEYPWSSHQCYAGKAVSGDPVDTDQVLRMFSEDKTAARKLYRAYMGDGISVDKDDIYNIADQRVLGDERFIEKVMDMCDVELVHEKREREYTLDEIAKVVEKVHGITLKQIRQKSKARDISIGKKILTIAAREYKYKCSEIAAFIKKDPAIVTRYLKEKEDMKEDVDVLIRMLKKNRANVNSQV
ncbi:MAG: transposase [Thermodesulfovibrionia bacterium]|nr:transposase [Thermodesulfovibrionia bacterium]